MALSRQALPLSLCGHSLLCLRAPPPLIGTPVDRGHPIQHDVTFTNDVCKDPISKKVTHTGTQGVGLLWRDMSQPTTMRRYPIPPGPGGSPEQCSLAALHQPQAPHSPRLGLPGVTSHIRIPVSGSVVRKLRLIRATRGLLVYRRGVCGRPVTPRQRH